MIKLSKEERVVMYHYREMASSMGITVRELHERYLESYIDMYRICEGVNEYGRAIVEWPDKSKGMYIGFEESKISN
jgi:hypothetical protein